MKKLIANLLPTSVKSFIQTFQNDYLDGYALKSYSHEGEDMILRRALEGRGTGFYVDVGAHHPKRFSNTYFFYKKGWRGINIDAMPGSMNLFNRLRPRDINIEAAILDEETTLTYHIFNEPALNTFSAALAEEYTSDRYYIVEKKQIKTVLLRDVLRDHVPAYGKIDFMSIDAEGVDLAVVKSNDWTTFRPEYLIVETGFSDFGKISESPLYAYIIEQGYVFFAKSCISVIFVDKTRLDAAS